MPHKEVTFDPWVDRLKQADPCLGRVVVEAVVAKGAAIDAGAAEKTAPKACRKAFQSAETTLASLRDGRLRPGTDAAWKKASDALRKFTQALDCTGAATSPGAHFGRARR